MTALAADLEQFVQEEITRGRFADRESVVAHVLRLLQRKREEAIHGIRLGLQDVAGGRVQPLGDAFADLRREVNEKDRHYLSDLNSVNEPAAKVAEGGKGTSSSCPGQGSRTVKQPNTSKSAGFSVRIERSPADQYVAASSVSSSRLRPRRWCFIQARNGNAAAASGKTRITCVAFQISSARSSAVGMCKGVAQRRGSVTICTNSARTCGARATVPSP